MRQSWFDVEHITRAMDNRIPTTRSEFVSDCTLEEENHDVEIDMDMGLGTPPGGMKALFIESFVAGVFLPDRPVPYSILFQPRTLSISRRPCIPPAFSMNFAKSTCSPVSESYSSLV